MQVADARATMAVFRLHRKEWEKGSRPVIDHGSTSKKRKWATANVANEGSDELEHDRSSKFPGGGRKGVSSGLSTVVMRGGGSAAGEKSKWWRELGGGSAKSKGSMRIKPVSR